MSSNIFLYSDNPTKKRQDGIKISENGKLTSPISTVLDSTKTEAKAIKLALRCQQGYETEGTITIKPQKIQLTSKTFSDSKDNLIYFAPDNNFIDEEQALTKGKWKKTLTIKEKIDSSNKIFWIKICSKKDEKTTQDIEHVVTVSGKIKNASESFTIHGDIFRRVSRKIIDTETDLLKTPKEYLDRFKKANYYKELIAKSFLSKGIYPNEFEIQERLEKINTSLSIFRNSPVVTGETFDAKKFNKNLFDIMQDLKILYECAYKICVEEYEEIKTFAETHLSELESLAAQYEYKSKYEIGSTYLGNTIFQQTSGFEETVENQRLIIELGTIKAHNGSKLACLFDGIGIAPTQVFFSFDGEYCSPYSLNRDFKIVEGVVTCNKYQVEIDEDTSINGAYQLIAENLIPSELNKYIIYAGKNNLTHSEAGKYISFRALENNQAVTISSAGEESFYILNGTYANFNFNVQPTKKNFDGNSINGLDSHHLIKIEHDSALTFSVNTDGTIYATKRNGFVEKDSLYYPDAHQVSSFLIEEYDRTAVTTFDDVKVIVDNCVSDNPTIINLIAVKELSIFEGVDF